MILFYGNPHPQMPFEEAISSASLKTLQKDFYIWKKWPTFSPDHTIIHTFNDAMERQLLMTQPGAPLVIHAHGSLTTFSGFTAEQIAAQLLTAGAKQANIPELWVAACHTGEQIPTNTLLKERNFIRELHTALREEIPGIKVFGPQGLLTMQMIQQPEGYFICTGTVIRSEDNSICYSFTEGWIMDLL